MCKLISVLYIGIVYWSNGDCWLGENDLGAKGNGKNFFRLECVVKWDDTVLLGMQPLWGT